MRWVAIAAALAVAVFLGGTLFVRLAPVDIAAWHRAPDQRSPGDHAGPGSFEAVRDLGDATSAEAAMAALDGVVLATPRTRRLAGVPEDGLVTYETRSALWGFPDYTTVARRDGVVHVWGRLRFGGDDLGANRARVLAWMAETEGLAGP